jgi:hypothetical protein
MNTNTKYLLALGLPLALSGALIAGCNSGQNSTATTGTTNAAQPVAQAGNTADAPANSSAGEAAHSDGDGHAHGEKPSAAEAMKADSPTTKLKFASVPASLPVGKPATWTLKIADAQSGQPVQKFDVVHDKLMHLIVVKNDLSWFNHIHPTHKGDGTFEISAALPREGTYKLYADYTPTGKKQEVAQHVFATGGAAPAPSNAQLTPDKMQGPWMIKRVTSHPEGEPEKKGGPTYEVALMPMPMKLKSGEDSMLHFQVRDSKGKPISDLQPYLGAMGHAVILSQDTDKYLHSHPMEGGHEPGAKHDMSKMGDMKHKAPPKKGGPDVMFHTNFPKAGLYKAWGQFMHRGQIITAAFTVNVAEGKPASTSVSDGHDHGAAGESEPHAH